MRRRPRLFSSVMIALSALVLSVPALASAPSETAQVAYYAPTFAGTLFVTQLGEIVYALSGPRTDAKRFRALEIALYRGPGDLPEPETTHRFC